MKGLVTGTGDVEVELAGIVDAGFAERNGGVGVRLGSALPLAAD